MGLEIYRVVDAEAGGFQQEEICRECAIKELDKGRKVEFDKHLSKYMHNKDGLSYYGDGEVEEEISCQLCEGNFEGDEDGDLLDAL